MYVKFKLRFFVQQTRKPRTDFIQAKLHIVLTYCNDGTNDSKRANLKIYSIAYKDLEEG